MNKAGLTLLEILVSMIILALITTGLASVFVSSRRLLMHSRGKITASQAIKYYLDPLQMEVSQRDWGTKCLNGDPTKCITTPITDTFTNTSFTPAWAISGLSDPTSTIRKVKLTINWTERGAE